MMSPPMILIDNGHFQYNNVCIGLSLGAFHFMTISENIGIYDVLGSVLFCLALNWKQMALYYAPAVFSFLLGKCFRPRKRACQQATRQQQDVLQSCEISMVLADIAKLGISVVMTFFILWYPFYHYRQYPDEEGVFDVFGPILKRIFPFSRGLFEGKVANIWCVGNIKPLSIRSRIPERYQALCALFLTLTMMMPFCVLLFQKGKLHCNSSWSNDSSSNSSSNANHSSANYVTNHGGRHSSLTDLTALLWGAAGTSLSFFLASFQVHEKSILLPLAPILLLQQVKNYNMDNNNMKNYNMKNYNMDHNSSDDINHSSINDHNCMKINRILILVMNNWFTIVCTWSLWHLMVLDRLQVIYFAIIGLYLCFLWGMAIFDMHPTILDQFFHGGENLKILSQEGWFQRFVFNKMFRPCILMTMCGLHVAEASILPPASLPDVFLVLWTVVGCISFTAMWIESLSCLYSVNVRERNKGRYKVD